MKFDKNKWKSIDINIDSLWIIGPRAKGGKRENNYYGNFVPQIPDHLIRRYTEPGDIVLEPFMGSGTTLYECESLGRNYIGFDINEEIIQYVQSKMGGDTSIDYSICLGDVCDEALSTAHISRFLKGLKKQRVDFVLSHPPYWDIVKFTDNEADLSQSKTLDRFLSLFLNSTKNTVRYLRCIFVLANTSQLLWEIYIEMGRLFPWPFI